MNNQASKQWTKQGSLSWWIAGIAFSVSSISMAFSLCGQDQTREFVAGPTVPEQWINRRLPVLDSINDQLTLARGSWLVLLLDRRCPDCVFLADDFIRLAENVAAAKSPATPRFCILEYGLHDRGERQGRRIRESSVVYCLSAPPSSQIVPGSRGILHLRDSEVAQVFAPTELGLVLKVFGS